jgi:hypothetical protein
MAIERTFPANPDVAIHITMNFMQLGGGYSRRRQGQAVVVSGALGVVG